MLLRQDLFTPIRVSVLIVCACMVSLSAHAQIIPGTRFEIGVSKVFHSGYSPWGVAAISTIDSLPPALWDRLVELGISLPLFDVVRVDDSFPRVLLDTAKARGLHVALVYGPIHWASQWERRYFQPEDAGHFAFHSPVSNISLQSGFDEMGLRFDVSAPDGVHAATDNGLLMREGAQHAGTVVGGFTQGRQLFINGHYYLSLRCGIAADAIHVPPNSDEPCLKMRFKYGDSVRTWTISGSAFYANDGSMRTAFEYLPRDGALPAVFVLRADTLDPGTQPMRVRYFIENAVPRDWGAGTWHQNVDIPGLLHRYHPTSPVMPDPDCELEVEYLGRGDVFIDAICFSDPHAYGLFVGDDNALPNFRDRVLRTELVGQLTRLGVDSDTSNALRFIQLQETSPHQGSLSTMNLITAYIDSLSEGSDRIRTFNYGLSGPGGYEELAFANNRIVSAVYMYSILSSLPGPDHPEYHAKLFNNPTGIFWYVSRQFHAHAIAQKQFHDPNPFPFIPAIANNDWSFRDGWRFSVPAGLAMEELREPTMAELRTQVNMALCYGAKSIMYYQYGSIPGAITDDTLDADGRFINRGINGFVNHDLTKRRRNIWGEDKWDSTRVFNTRYLREMGDMLLALKWEHAFAYDDRYLRDQDNVILSVTSERLGVGRDLPAQTWVEVGRFSDPAQPGTMFLFVLNKRMDAPGQRHITVRLDPGQVQAPLLRITNLLSDSSWTASPSELVAIGIPAFYPSGGAQLFRIEADTTDGATQPSVDFALHPNYPNPCNASTTILYALPVFEPVHLTVHDVLGRVIDVLVNGEEQVGRQFRQWRFDNIVPGLYFIRLQQGGMTATRALHVLR